MCLRMKITPSLRASVLEMVETYAARFSVPAPRILLSTREVLNMPKHVTAGRRTTAYKYYGVAYMQHNVVFLNIRKISDMKVLEKTIVHEIAHLRFPYLAHGKRFNNIVKKGLRGSTFRPYVRRSIKYRYII